MRLHFDWKMLSRVEQASVCGWLSNINPVCCCFSLMFSDSLARSDLFVWVPEENSKTNRGQICTAPRRSFPSLYYFQHLHVTMASAAERSLNRPWVISPLNWRYLWVFGTAPSAALCVTPTFLPLTILCVTILMSSDWHRVKDWVL